MRQTIPFAMRAGSRSSSTRSGTPGIFVFDDFEQYRKKRGFIFDNIEYYMPGPHIQSFDKLLQFVNEVLNGVDNYKGEREKINKLFNKYNDDKSSERLWREIINRIDAIV